MNLFTNQVIGYYDIRFSVVFFVMPGS
jgi:hypothetical protein